MGFDDSSATDIQTGLTASCLCGEARLALGKPIGPGGYCHCRDCHKITGSAFSVTIPFESGDFHVISGEIGSFTKVADSGNEVTRHFCRNCGSPLFGRLRQYPEMIFIRAGIIDQPITIKPARQSWCRSRLDWATIDPELPSLPKGL
jgi:hypothetical protein